MNRRTFLQQLGIAAGGLASVPLVAGASTRAYEFVFARLRYDSGDWDYNPKVCANVLDAVVQYTEIPVRQDEVVITLDSAELASFPFLFMTGHKLVRFSEKERQGLVRYVENGGLLFSDDCNHDVNGLYAKSFETEMHRAFPGANVLSKLPSTHPVFRAFFPSTRTSVGNFSKPSLHRPPLEWPDLPCRCSLDSR